MNINKLSDPLYALAIIAAAFLMFFAVPFLVIWVATSIDAKPPCESAYITIAASELCSAEKSCSLTIHDVEKYLKARRVHGECLREGAYD